MKKIYTFEEGRGQTGHLLSSDLFILLFSSISLCAIKCTLSEPEQFAEVLLHMNFFFFCLAFYNIGRWFTKHTARSTAHACIAQLKFCQEAKWNSLNFLVYVLPCLTCTRCDAFTTTSMHELAANIPCMFSPDETSAVKQHVQQKMTFQHSHCLCLKACVPPYEPSGSYCVSLACFMQNK